jgi:hypothetical protein
MRKFLFVCSKKTVFNLPTIEILANGEHLAK